MLTDSAPSFPDSPLFEEPPVVDTKYGGSLVVFCEVASQLGVDVTEEDRHSLRVVLGAAMFLDHLLDAVREDGSSFVSSFVNVVNGELRDDINETVQVRTSNYMARQQPERQRHIYDQVCAVAELTSRQREATNAREVVAIRLAEADILGELLRLDYEPGQSDSDGRNAFNTWVFCWSRVGYTFDSLIDLRRDYKNGEHQVKATLGAGAIFGTAVIREARTALRQTPLRAMMKCAAIGINYVIRQHRPEVQAPASA
ncbi:MAG TPA: hypothetical protein VMB52_05390 [Verrucomicrobiae bacterium]|nr:hypothetical protein [Verrucomicrobiae bacterium]